MTSHAAYLQRYTPHLPAPVWVTIRSHFLAVMMPYAMNRSLGQVKRVASHLSGYLGWAMNSGVVSAPGDAANASLIDAYVAQRRTVTSETSAAGERNALYAVYGMDSASPMYVGLARVAAEPYSPHDIGLIRLWATHQPTARQSHIAATVAALSLGCGLTRADVLDVRGRDIVKMADGGFGVEIHGTAARTVPALAEWSPALEHVREAVQPDGYILGSGQGQQRYNQKVLTDLLRRTTGDIKPLFPRMRTTWLVQHLDARTPMNLLMRAAGVGYASFVSRLVPHMREFTPAEELAFLRNPGGAHREGV